MTTEDRQHIAALAIAGICSGILSGSLVSLANDTLSPYIPGLVYGLVIGLYFLSLQNKSALLSTLLFVIYSTGSYFTALLLMYYLPMQSIFLVLLAPAFFIYAGVLLCGIIGTSLFLIAFSKLIFPLSKSEYKKLLLIGSLLSLACQCLFIAEIYLGSKQTLISETFTYGVFFIWQTGMATALGWTISRSSQIKTDFRPSKRLIVNGVIVLLVLVSSYYYYYNNYVKPLQESTYSDTKFHCFGQPCSEDLSTLSPTPTLIPFQNYVNGSSRSDVDTSSWNTYTHPQGEISFRYPADWALSIDDELISLSKTDSEGTGIYFIKLDTGAIVDEGAGSASNQFTAVDTFTRYGKNVYILKGEDNSSYAVSACEAPTKCLIRTNKGHKIDFYAYHYNPGDQAVMPFPSNDPITDTLPTILKTIEY